MPNIHMLYFLKFDLENIRLIVIQVSSLAGESFPALSAEEAMKFGTTTRLLQFGTSPPVAIIEYEGQTHYHFTVDSAQPIIPKDAPAKAKGQRMGAITEARSLLKNPEKHDAEESKEVLNALHNAAYKLSLSICKARSSGNTNTARNYKRKRSQVKGLYAAVNEHVARDIASDEEPHGQDYADPIDAAYVLSVKT